jgi:hypothetical protein
MRFMVMVKATKGSEAGVMPTQADLAAMGAFNEELARAGVMEAGEGLHPSARGARVAMSGRDRRVVDGPFAATGELVAGFWIWKCASLQEAIEWVKKCPNPMPTDSEIEVRQIFSAEDFGDALTPELREQEAQLRNPPFQNALASVAVKDLKHASAWYAQLLGRPADKTPMPTVAAWSFPRGGVLQVYELGERAGQCSCTLAVTGLDGLIARLDGLGIDTRTRTRSKQVSTVMVQDPDGNHVALAEAHAESVSR